ncbi:hypothetical protein COCSADRAFT_32187 [Bipolaris sorokiniana ND90Pr]|uniref:Uncharacterized protein n=1 Tax=Cochliobolus sativus (strain ND90Pr / ATCC 201652) TaxID=665912 RepID=M2T4Y3_COCSN|nr:uncharacterized protein COCSADRAFT_32187 [Bipolaris sorokiniana ND90Pr]EMD69485.1 hypothetical protein COCSADRAFT_32187 [Bipolaris sorokiniana ND90Pr]
MRYIIKLQKRRYNTARPAATFFPTSAICNTYVGEQTPPTPRPDLARHPSRGGSNAQTPNPSQLV